MCSNTRSISEAKCADLRGSWPALQRAAQRAREVAWQTGTAIVVSRQGVIEHLPPQPWPAPTVQEPSSSYGDKR